MQRGYVPYWRNMNNPGVIEKILQFLFNSEFGLQCLTALVLTGLCGTIMYGLWCMICRLQQQKNAVKLQFYLFRLTVTGFCVPVLYVWYSVHSLWMNPGARSGPFLLGTRMMCFWANVLFFFWLWGVGKRVQEKWRERHQFRQATAFARTCSEEKDELLRSLCRKRHIQKQIRLCESTAVQSPSIDGIWHPVIYLDSQSYSRSEMETILTHELTHFLHGDLVQRWLLQLMSVVYWFHPLFSTGKIYEENRRISEAYCDSTVCGLMEQRSYIRSLLTIILRENRSEKQQKETGCALAESASEVCDRIAQMEKNSTCKAIKGLAALECILVFSVASVTAAYGAGTVYSAGYEMVYWNSSDDWQEETFYSSMKRQDKKTAEDGESENTVWQLQPESIVESKALYCRRGQICVQAETDRPDEKLCIGVITPEGIRRYSTESGELQQIFSIEKSGRYRIFVWNRGQSAVQIKLRVTANN